MQFKKLLLLLAVNFFTFTLSAQNLKFPISGTYKVQDNQGKTPIGFNIVSVNNAFFSLFQDETELESYKLVSANQNDFDVERYFGENVNRDARRFTVHFDQITEDDCFVTIVYPDRSEKFHLVKSEI